MIDLFSGVGGFSLSAARSGFRVAMAAEMDGRCITAHRFNFPSSAHLQVDLATCTGKQLLEAAGLVSGELDGLIGGPPCQGFSSIGRKDALDPRNQLVAHFFRLVKEIQPKFFVMENVPGLMSPDHRGILQPLLTKASKRYRIVGPVLLRASDFGAPTIRRRAFILGFNDLYFDKNLRIEDLEPQLPSINVREALMGLPKKLSDSLFVQYAPGVVRTTSSPALKYQANVLGKRPDGVGNDESFERVNHRLRVSGMMQTNHSEALRKRYAALGPGEVDRATKSQRLIATGFCPTLRAGTGPERGSFQAVRPIHYREPRVITPREAARLQGFPDWFEFHETIWHSFRMIGNSVCPIVGEAVLAPISAALS